MILNKTTKHRERYRILPGNMGNHGDPKDSPNHKYHVANGIGPNYCGSMSIEYFLSNENIPEEAKQNAIKFLLERGYGAWLQRKNLLSESLLTERK